MSDINKRELLDDILSHNAYRVWLSSGTLAKYSQNEDIMREFIPYLDEIKAETSGLELGGLLGTNKRFVDKVIKILEHYKVGEGCSCCLFAEDDNPQNFETLNIEETVNYNGINKVDYYIVECKKCGKRYKVHEREYHFPWWEWTNYEE